MALLRFRYGAAGSERAGLSALYQRQQNAQSRSVSRRTWLGRYKHP